MTTLIGAALIILGGTLAGLSAVKKLSERKKILASLVAAADYLNAEIKYGLTALPDIMKKLDANYPDLFFAQCVRKVTPELGFGVIWKNALRCAKLPLRADELEALEELGNILGRFDADAQQSAILLARERLQLSYMAARDECMSKSKLFGFLGVALGVVVTILLV